MQHGQLPYRTDCFLICNMATCALGREERRTSGSSGPPWGALVARECLNSSTVVVLMLCLWVRGAEVAWKSQNTKANTILRRA